MFLLHFSIQCNLGLAVNLWILPCLHQNGNAAFSWFLQEATTFQLSLSTHVPLSAYELSLSTANELSIRWSFHPLMPYPLRLYPLKLYPLMHYQLKSLSVEALIRWWILSVEALETSVEALFLIRWSSSISVDTSSLIQNYKAWNIYN